MDTDPFDELSPEDIELLPEEERAGLEQLLAMDPEERTRFLGHMQLVSAGWSFLRRAVEEGDLRSSWSLVDPVLRRCLVQQWLLDNASDVAAGGFDREEVLEALVLDDPEHPLWAHFERVHVRGLHRVVPGPDVWGIGSQTRLVAPDVEVLYVHDMTGLPDGVWHPGAVSHVWPLLMRWDGSRWLVLNLGSETSPEPGWPPTLA
jgi:hypothetical protein